MDVIFKKIFDHALGNFLQVDSENVHFSPASGQASLRRAEFKAEVFDEIHLPVTLRGGFIEDMSVTLEGSAILGTSKAKVIVKDVFLLFGPHVSDWSWQHVYECRTKLVNLARKIFELSGKDGTVPSSKEGWFKTFSGKSKDAVTKYFFGILEVSIANIHIRYEDPFAQSGPVAFGFKVGAVSVHSSDKVQGDENLAKSIIATGDWLYSPASYADALFNQFVRTRRISLYWDVGKAPYFDGRTCSGQEVRRKFKQLNTRETFATAVVDLIMCKYPPDHERRRILGGPTFRERLDFHKFILFPSSFTAHIVFNRITDATKTEKAPTKDANLIVEPLEIAVDSHQVQSMNEFILRIREFGKYDELLRSRPRESISTCLETARSGHGKMPGPQMRLWIEGVEEEFRQKRTRLIAAWWLHAFHGVCLLCQIPKQTLRASELLKRKELQTRFTNLCLQEMSSLDVHNSLAAAGPSRILCEMQMSLALSDILRWRQRARVLHCKLKGNTRSPTAQEVVKKDIDDFSKLPNTPENKRDTLQVTMRLKALRGFFLTCASQFWNLGLQASNANWNSNGKRRPTPAIRQVIINMKMNDANFDFVQKGCRHRRIARWAEMTVGSIQVQNEGTKTASRSVRDIIAIDPLESMLTIGGPPVCLFVGASSMQVHDDNMYDLDTPMAAVMEPWGGLTNHLKSWPKQVSPEHAERLGLLTNCKDGPNKVFAFAFSRVGFLRGLDYQPFRRQLQWFLQRGKQTPNENFQRRPSVAAVAIDARIRFQRQMEIFAGRRHILGMYDFEIDGVLVKMVETYSQRSTQCKEMALPSIQVRVHQSGCPQSFQVQIRKLNDRPFSSETIFEANAARSGVDLLPWKVSMYLLPRSLFLLTTDEIIEAQMIRTSKPDAVQGQSEGWLCEKLQGAYFKKWGRNGRYRQRFVAYDESLEAVTWRSRASSKSVIGAIPLAKVQDICRGVATPVLKKASGAHLRPECCWSLVVPYRTLDLEAETVALVLRWTNWLRARFEQQMQRLKASASGCSDERDRIEHQFPQVLEKKTKVYQKEFRPPIGEFSTLRLSRCTKKSSDHQMVNSARSGYPK